MREKERENGDSEQTLHMRTTEYNDDNIFMVYVFKWLYNVFKNATEKLYTLFIRWVHAAYE